VMAKLYMLYWWLYFAQFSSLKKNGEWNAPVCHL